jgi:hypothetical protein
VKKPKGRFVITLQIGFREFTLIDPKAFSKMGPKAGYQEIVAKFVGGGKQAPAQWYSIRLLHNIIPSLVDLLKVSADKLQSVKIESSL